MTLGPEVWVKANLSGDFAVSGEMGVRLQGKRSPFQTFVAKESVIDASRLAYDAAIVAAAEKWARSRLRRNVAFKDERPIWEAVDAKLQALSPTLEHHIRCQLLNHLATHNVTVELIETLTDVIVKTVESHPAADS